ncbi:MAG: hypothetical protein ABSC05_28370 [Candidatus Solibacter sp.]|jgi:hypothetical protein
MATSPTVFAPQKSLEDPLAHLPCSSIVEYKKGQIIVGGGEKGHQKAKWSPA